MNTQHTKTRNGRVLHVVVLGTALLAGGLTLAGFAVAKSLRFPGVLPNLRTELIDDLDLRTASTVQIKAPPLLFSFARCVSHFVDIQPEAQSALQAVRYAQVGVYELTERPSVKIRRRMLDIADNRMGKDGWERVACVLDGNDLVLVYVPDGKDSTDQLKVSVLVLNDRELVLVSACGELSSLSDLVQYAKSQLDRT